jgi:hypothetical protein
VPADAPPADTLLVLDFEEFESRTTVRATKRPGYFPHAGCVFDIFDAQVLRPLYPVGVTRGNVLIVS